MSITSLSSLASSTKLLCTTALAPPRRSFTTTHPALSQLHLAPPRTHYNFTMPRKKASPAHSGDTDATAVVPVNTNPDANPQITDGKAALRASPDAHGPGESLAIGKVTPAKRGRKPKVLKEESSDLSDVDGVATPSPAKKARKTPTKSALAAKKGADEIKAFKAEMAAKAAKVKKEDPDEAAMRDPEADDEGGVPEDVDAVKREAGRKPPVHSDYLPLPWKGRLGYACLNTYLRFSNPPVFSSRTCRIASILEHRHPLADPSQPEHATKNRPDKTQPASIERGQAYVEAIGLANAKDIIKMMRWNERYGIRFMRLSSEMFPFASHEEYGYTLESFAGETLKEVGKVAGELGHRLTTHPGQFTQLGSPRQAVIDNAIRDLIYHDEMLSLLKLPPQQDRDAVMILHLGGVFGDKDATVQRFKDNYVKLPQSVKNRLVLENDDVSWSVHDLLPICEELNIPMVLDYHHHNIIFDEDKLREGTKDIMGLYPRITATWTRKGITQKMHYSEPTAQAVTKRDRRKHNPRPATLPPCAQDMDLMIEAKDKEQAVFELMRTFKLPGWDTFNNIIPYERADDNKPPPRVAKKKKTKKQIKAEEEDPSLIEDEDEPLQAVIPEEDVGMGGPEGRVYWPPGMEEWLRPKKREVKKKDDKTLEEIEKEAFKKPTPMNLAIRQEAKHRMKEMEEMAGAAEAETPVKGGGKAAKSAPKKASAKKAVKAESEEDEMSDEEEEEEDFVASEDGHAETPVKGARQSARKSSSKKKSYVEADEDDDMSM